MAFSYLTKKKFIWSSRLFPQNAFAKLLADTYFSLAMFLSPSPTILKWFPQSLLNPCTLWLFLHGYTFNFARDSAPYFYTLFLYLFSVPYFCILFLHLIFAPYFCILFLHPISASYFSTLFLHLIFASFFCTLFLHVISAPYFCTLFLHLISASYFCILFLHLIFAPYFCTLFLLLISAPYFENEAFRHDPSNCKAEEKRWTTFFHLCPRFILACLCA